MKKIRVGFIGCGGITQLHLKHGLAKFPDVEFAGWCDVNLDAANTLAKEHGGKAYKDFVEMLDDAKPDAVFIMLPPFTHGPAENAVIDRKIPFFVEKPIHLSFTEARKIAERVKKENIITGVGYMNRFRKGVQKVKSLLGDQPLVMLYGGWFRCAPEKYEGIWKWWVQKDKSGGQFWEQTTHTTDLALYFGGEVAEVHAVPITGREKRPDFFTIEDASLVTVRFKSGAAGTLFSSVCTKASIETGLTVHGTAFKAQFSEWIHNLDLNLAGGEKASLPGEENIFALEDRAFIDSVRDKNQHSVLASYEDGLAALAVAEAANRSFKTGKPVSVAELYA
jgi:myo-inositol 2-dehydrogenase / D-chiro-inositol 1-dehydrogenase